MTNDTGSSLSVSSDDDDLHGYGICALQDADITGQVPSCCSNMLPVGTDHFDVFERVNILAIRVARSAANHVSGQLQRGFAGS